MQTRPEVHSVHDITIFVTTYGNYLIVNYTILIKFILVLDGPLQFMKNCLNIIQIIGVIMFQSQLFEYSLGLNGYLTSIEMLIILLLVIKQDLFLKYFLINLDLIFQETFNLGVKFAIVFIFSCHCLDLEVVSKEDWYQ